MGWANVVQGAVGLYGASQDKKAAGAQEDAANAGLDFTKQVYGDSQSNFSPYLQQGQTGVNGLSALAGGDYSGFQNSPDYLYARDEMKYGLEHRAAARGASNAGGTGLDMAQHLNGLASQNLGNYRNSLQFLSQSGQNAAGTLGGIGTGTSQMVNNAYGNVGDARASGYGANANAAYGLGGLFSDWYNGKQS